MIEKQDKGRSLFPAVSLNLTTEVIDGSPQRVIVEQAENWSADLIVLGSHGRGFWSRTMIGSVSDSVVHHAPCSVLVVRTAQNSSKFLFDNANFGDGRNFHLD